MTEGGKMAKKIKHIRQSKYGNRFEYLSRVGSRKIISKRRG
jgi:hypothetical protein